MIDAKKLKKSVHKKGFITELAEPTTWISTGNYALNFVLTGDFYRAIPNHRSFCLAGPQGSGKSLIMASLIERSQKEDPDRFIVYIDTEEAINNEHLDGVGVDRSEDRFMPIKADTVEEVSEIFKELVDNTTPEDKLFVVLDSSSNLDTEKDLEKWNKNSGELGNDQGLFAKKLKQMIKTFNKQIAKRDIIFGYTSQVYQNQDVTNGKGKYIVSGGEAQLHIPSLLVMFDKLKLKEGSDVVGIRLKVQTEKNRFNQPFMSMTLHVPYNTGIDPYDGLADFLEKEKLITKSGAWFSFEDVDGNTHKFQKKNIESYFDLLIAKWEAVRGAPSQESEEENALLEENEEVTNESVEEST